MGRRALAVFFGLFVAGVVAPIGCVDPTEVKLVLSTNVCELRKVAIFVGGAQVAEKVYDPDPQCVTRNGRDLGTLMMVPSGRGDRFTVSVEGTPSDGVCSADAAGRKKCIIASRTVSFQPHVPLTLPIELERACLDRDCPADQTCVRGACVSQIVDCKTNKTCVEDGGALVDALPPLEAGLGDGEAGAACVSGILTLKPSPPTHHWNFEEQKAQVTDLISSTTVPLAVGYLHFPNTGECGTALTLGSVAMPLGVQGLSRLALKVRGQGLQVTTLVSGGQAPSSWSLQTEYANPGVRLVLAVTQGSSFLVKSTLMLPNDFKWHAVEVVAAGTSVDFAIDGKSESVPSTGPLQTSPLALTLGPATGIDIDELWTYGP